MLSSLQEVTRNGRQRLGEHNRTTEEVGIVTTGVFRQLDWDYRGN